jgi:predicted RNase H-like HicB family nuclease
MDYKYRMNVWWSPDDGLWLVEVPDLPGAMADGATPEEAVANAQVVIGNWIAIAREDGTEVPEPQVVATR